MAMETQLSSYFTKNSILEPKNKRYEDTYKYQEKIVYILQLSIFFNYLQYKYHCCFDKPPWRWRPKIIRISKCSSGPGGLGNANRLVDTVIWVICITYRTRLLYKIISSLAVNHQKSLYLN